MADVAALVAEFPRPLTAYADASGQSLAGVLAARLEVEPFNAVATGIFVLAILHTFAAARFTAFAHAVQHRHDEHERANGRKPTPSPKAEVLHFFGEVEVIFGLWAVILFVTAVGYAGWEAATHYVNSIAYTEALFVVVIMALA